ncbi:MAG: signal peptidase [Frankiales bacterium]|nr:signal peptidase [Frankiales bacterium]
MLRHLWAALSALTAMGAVAVAMVLYPAALGWHVYEVPSGAMVPTLPVGSHIASEPTEATRRGDIVVMRQPWPPAFQGRESTFVKRVIAVGGDTIQCCDPAGRVVLNGRPLNESYLYQDDKQPFDPVDVPPGRLFVMGDHRSESADSRAHQGDGFGGTVAESTVVGVVHGPYSHLGAARPFLGHFLPYLLGVGLFFAGGTEALFLLIPGRHRRQRRLVI